MEIHTLPFESNTISKFNLIAAIYFLISDQSVNMFNPSRPEDPER